MPTIMQVMDEYASLRMLFSEGDNHAGMLAEVLVVLVEHRDDPLAQTLLTLIAGSYDE